ncbi:MAG: DMT family transporter [bacterium]
MTLGLRYMVESAFYFSIMSVLVKFAGRTVPFQEIVLARTAVAFVASIVMLRARGISVWGVNRPLLVLRGVLGFVGLVCFYYSITHLPLADASVIQYTNPVLVAVLAALLLGEALTVGVVVSAIACFIGVVMIARPAFLFGAHEPLPPVALAAAITGALVSSFAYTVVRKLGATDHPIVIVFWFPLVALPFALPWAISTGYVPNVHELALLLGVGIATQAAQVRMTQGLQLEQAGRATSITYLQVVFAFVWGLLLFDEVPAWPAVLGAVTVLAAVVFVARSRRAHG